MDDISTTTAAKAQDVTADKAGLTAPETKVEQPKPTPKAKDENAEDAGASEETDSDDGEGDDASDDSGEQNEDKRKRKSGFQRRIEKLNKRNAEKEAEANYWKQKALEKEQSEPAKPAAKANEESEGPKRPDSADFETHDEYIDAVYDWKEERKEREREAKAAEAKAKETQANAQKAYEEKISAFGKAAKEFSEAHEDFDQVCDDVDDVIIPFHVQQEIFDSENGPELLYQLAKNKAEFARICSLSPAAALRALGRFEAGLQSSTQETKEPKQIKKTNAPAPLKPVGSKSTAAKKSLEEMDADEYMEARRAQRKNR